MLNGLFTLIALSVVMTVASFLAGALPLSMALSTSQMRLISAIGMGVLVGTSLAVVIPEGIETVYAAGYANPPHGKRDIDMLETIQRRALEDQLGMMTYVSKVESRALDGQTTDPFNLPGPLMHAELGTADLGAETTKLTANPSSTKPADSRHDDGRASAMDTSGREQHRDFPTFWIGFALIAGFILMFLIDKLPRLAAENLQQAPTTRHISLDNLSRGLHAATNLSIEDEDESFLQSLAPTARQTRSLATTTGLVIHAAADGIAMGASAASPDTRLGFIIFLAIMIHKAPAAFGLSSVLLKQGLSKRAARGHLIVFSLAAPFGALSTWILVNVLGGGEYTRGETGQWWTGILLLFSAGTFLYVAMHAMQEETAHEHTSSNGYADGGGFQRKPSKAQMTDTLAAVGGMLIPLLTQIVHHH